MVNYLTETLMVEAAGCVVWLWTESSIATGGRILSIVKRVAINIYYPVLLETENYRV